jgi:hypothetical protein
MRHKTFFKYGGRLLSGMAHSGAVLLNAFPLKMLRLACVTFALNLQRTPNDQ